MHTALLIMIGIIAAIHCYILWLEMFAWTGRARKVFRGYDAEFFEKTKVMAGNQGLYNGFLAAGLIWALFIENREWQLHIAVFFLSCVLAAGLYGAYTADKKILGVQAFPALVGLVLVLLQ